MPTGEALGALADSLRVRNQLIWRPTGPLVSERQRDRVLGYAACGGTSGETRCLRLDSERSTVDGRSHRAVFTTSTMAIVLRGKRSRSGTAVIRTPRSRTPSVGERQQFRTRRDGLSSDGDRAMEVARAL